MMHEAVAAKGAIVSQVDRIEAAVHLALHIIRYMIVVIQARPIGKRLPHHRIPIRHSDSTATTIRQMGTISLLLLLHA